MAKFLGNRNLKLHEAGHCIEYDLRCEKITRDIHVSPGYKMEIGYSWIFPTSSGYQVGLGMVRKVRKSLKIYLDEYLDWAVKHKLIPERYEIKKVSGGVVPLRIAKKYATDRILLCGDAMGLVKLLIGEGIYYAMKSGKIAGQAISESRKNLKARYRKKIRPVIFEIFLTPYIPPKIFTLTFWTLFFMIGKYVDKLNVFNPIIDFFSRMVIHRQKTAGSFYSDEKITK